MGRIGKIILRKLKVDGYSQTLGSRDRMAWEKGRTSTKETGVQRVQAFTLKSKVADPKQSI